MRQIYWGTAGAKWRARLSILLCLALLFGSIPGIAFGCTNITFVTSLDSGQVAFVPGTGSITATATVESVGTPHLITEFSWAIYDSNNQLVQQGGTGQIALPSTKTETLVIPVDALGLAPGIYTVQLAAQCAQGNSPFVSPARPPSFSVLGDDETSPVAIDDVHTSNPYPVLMPAFITIAATDLPGAPFEHVSGVDTITWAVYDAADPGTPVASDTVPGESAVIAVPLIVGTYTLEYTVTDNAGNFTSYGPVTFNVSNLSLDITAPRSSSDAVALYTAPASISITATDPANAQDPLEHISGVESVAWALYDAAAPGTPVASGAAPGDAASVVVPSVPGVYTLEFWAKDAAGNTEAPANTVSFRVGSEVIKIPPVSTCDAKRSYVDSATITITASSANGSGIGFITYILDGGQPVVVDGDIAIVIVSSEETHTLEFWATDKDNNEEISHNMVTFEVVSEGMHGGSIIRVYGADRYETGLDASRRNFNKAEAVIIATGANYADALSASALAGSLKAPLLLTKPDTLSPGVLGEIKRLEAKKAYIMGSTAAVSQGVEASLKDAGLNIERIGGPDRYATSAEVAKKVAVLEGPGFAKKVLLARGDDFADGLSGSPLAYINKIPVLLTRPTALSTYASDVIIGLEVRDVTVLGSTAAVSAGVEDSVRGIDTSPTVRRVAGANRYETAQEIATYAFTNSLATKRFLGVATGQNFPDALTGGVATGERGGVLILTTNSTLSSNWLSYLPSTYAGIKPDIQVYGGSNVVTDGVMSTLQGLLLD